MQFGGNSFNSAAFGIYEIQLNWTQVIEDFHV